MKLSAELLSPAGNAEALRAAVINGADAVYLALDKFGARAKAENFTPETLADAVTYAHIHGVKIHVAVNTLLADSELPQAMRLMEQAWDLGVDACIVQDLGLVRQVRHTMPDIVLHASTQMGIHNVDGARFIEDLGIRRVVLSRETELADISAIHDATGLEIEYFVQGALCVAFSGNCLMSSMVSGLSGNRGRCLQLCRKKYDIVCDGVKKSGYYLSPKDICMLDHLSALCDAGVTSFKIEGRMRSTEYVAEATRIYRKALDGERIMEKDRDALKAVFNRGDYCAGYLQGNQVIYPDMQGHKGVRIGKVTAVRDGLATVSTSALSVGDGIKFIDNTQEVGSALVSGNPTTFVGSVRAGNEVYRTSSVALREEVLSRQNKVPIDISVLVRAGRPLRITLAREETCVSAEGAIAQPAISAPLQDDAIAASVSKLGDTEYRVGSLRIDNDCASFVPKSALNAARRQAVDLLNGMCSKRVDLPKDTSYVRHTNYNMSRIASNQYSDCLYIIESEAQLRMIWDYVRDANVLVSPKRYAVDEIAKLFAQLGDRGILDLPIMVNARDWKKLRQTIDEINPKHICVQNPYGFAFAEHRGVLLGYGMNILNRASDIGELPYMQSLEATRVIDANAYVYAFGFPPLMTCKHCPRKTIFGCESCRGEYDYTLKDEKGSFFVRHYSVSECYAQICAYLPVYICDELDRCGHRRRVYDFRGCDEDAIFAVLSGKPIAHNHFNFNKKLV